MAISVQRQDLPVSNSLGPGPRARVRDACYNQSLEGGLLVWRGEAHRTHWRLSWESTITLLLDVQPIDRSSLRSWVSAQALDRLADISRRVWTFKTPTTGKAPDGSWPTRLVASKLAGASVLGIGANTMHMNYETVVRCGVRSGVDIRDAVVTRLTEMKATSLSLSGQSMMESDFYSAHLESRASRSSGPWRTRSKNCRT